jgi:polysaccharide export outer membrane protein
MPRDAPGGEQIRNSASVVAADVGDHVRYALVKLTPGVVAKANSAISSQNPSTLLRLPKAMPAGGTIGVGDVLAIQLFEAQSGGLFNPHEPGGSGTRPNFVLLPNQQVDASGYITVPYAGNIKVAGLEAKQLSNVIADRLKGRAIDPQAIVSIVDRRSSEVSVLGEVGIPGRFALDPGGMRISEAVARSGGPKFPDYETAFVLDRQGTRYRGDLSSIIQNPRLDVQLRGGDLLYLSHVPKYIMVFGATLDPTLTSITRRVTFESSRLSLTEALAKAGGLNTNRADARSVFVLRTVAKSTLAQMNVDTSGFVGDSVPAVFSVNLEAADGYFLGESLDLQNRDVVLVSDALYEDLTKAFTLLNQISLTPVATIAATK